MKRHSGESVADLSDRRTAGGFPHSTPSPVWLSHVGIFQQQDSVSTLSSLPDPSLLSPVHGDRCHGVDAGEDCSDGEEVVEAAVSFPKVPLVVQGIDEVDEGVESSHGGIREGQVHQEIVGHRPHTLVSQDDPDDNQVAKDGHRHHPAISQRPQGNAPGGLHKLVGEVSY